MATRAEIKAEVQQVIEELHIPIDQLTPGEVALLGVQVKLARATRECICRAYSGIVAPYPDLQHYPIKG